MEFAGHVRLVWAVDTGNSFTMLTNWFWEFYLKEYGTKRTKEANIENLTTSDKYSALEMILGSCQRKKE